MPVADSICRRRGLAAVRRRAPTADSAQKGGLLGLSAGPVQGRLSSQKTEEGYAVQPMDMPGMDESARGSMQRRGSTVQAYSSTGQPHHSAHTMLGRHMSVRDSSALPHSTSLEPQGSISDARGSRLETQGSSLQAHSSALQSKDAAVELQGNVQQPQGRTVLPQSMVVQSQSSLQQLEGSRMQACGLALEPQGCLLQPQGSTVQPQGRAPELQLRGGQPQGSMVQPWDTHEPHFSIKIRLRKRKAGEDEVEEQDAKRRALSPDEPGVDRKEAVRTSNLPCDMNVHVVTFSPTFSSDGLTSGSGDVSGGFASLPIDTIRSSGDGSDDTAYNLSNGTGSCGHSKHSGLGSNDPSLTDNVGSNACFTTG